MTENAQLELAPDELTVPLKVTLGNGVYRVRHRLRPPSAADWYAYDAALARGYRFLSFGDAMLAERGA